jgi:hypothetical protein
VTARPTGPKRPYLTLPYLTLPSPPPTGRSPPLSPSQDAVGVSSEPIPAPSLGSRLAAIDHFRFLIALVKAPCFAAFPSPKAGEFTGFNVFLDAIINCAREPISATPRC